MSTSRGNTSRKRAQKHQNKTAFKNDLHDTSQKTKFLNSMELKGVCKRCKDILEWKIKFKKYKPLTAPRKCVDCEQKSIKYAYHLLCSNCALKKTVCAKCCKPFDDQIKEEINEDKTIQQMLKGLPERKRRSIIRYINKHQEGSSTNTFDIMAHIEDVLAGLKKLDFNEDDDFHFSSSQSDTDNEGT
ncbi:uncharacterized protein C9orf85 homolog [Galleria mellonella]|uniref:Uncharacterized protein C9orf85 homolog n=1 Tax=Galleria mellonella TaxID=7137 RepID=A0A6J1X970_GALME|nr:uncharacterized protein C9orf85 homolog [Galleria mellonella]